MSGFGGCEHDLQVGNLGSIVVTFVDNMTPLMTDVGGGHEYDFFHSTMHDEIATVNAPASGNDLGSGNVVIFSDNTTLTATGVQG